MPTPPALEFQAADPGDHPIDQVLEHLGRLRSCADLVELITDSLQPERRYFSQYYTVAETIRSLVAAADKAAILVCEEQNRMEAEARAEKSKAQQATT